MIEPLTQVEVEQRILECIDDLAEATDGYRALSAAAGRAEVNHKSVRAAALRTASGPTVGDREAEAERASRVEFEQRKDAESSAAVQKEVLVSLRAILSAYQSLLSAIRAQT